MSTPLTLVTRRMELERRSNILLTEVEKWVTRTSDQLDFNTHYSQLQALYITMKIFFDKQKNLLEKLKTTAEIEDFQIQIFTLLRIISMAQGLWDFFRDKLELRFNPDLRDQLAFADTVSFDCYRSTLDKAKEFKIITADQFREPPLTYLEVVASPGTLARGRGIPGYQDQKLPIPIIELPWDHITNLWEYLSLPHEVVHDLEADLNLRPVLINSLNENLITSGVPESRISIWLKWQKEIFADLVALLLAGPAFAYSMINTLFLPHQEVISYNDDDSHPSHYIRIFLISAFVRTLITENENIKQDADRLDKLWIQLYGNIEKIGSHKVDDFQNDFPIVFNALIDTKFDILKGHSVRELIPYTVNDDAKIRNAITFLKTGQNRPSPHSLNPRHIVSASRLALDQIAIQSDDDSTTKINDLNTRTAELIKDNTKPGVRAAVSGDNEKHRKFVESLAEALYENSLKLEYKI